MDDRELNQLLREWKASDAPPTFALRASVGKPAPKKPWWNWLLTGSIRIPVPVGVAAALLAAFWIYSVSERAAPAPEPDVASREPVVSLADFQPVEEVEIRVVGDFK
jgi:hypothetical protein